jgi:hypothetical protein
MELERYAPIPLALPPRQTTVVVAERVERLPGILDRADLALSPLDTRLGPGGSLEAHIHNIGARAARDVQVVLERGGRAIASRTVPALDAPLDLVPRYVALRFDQARPGDRLAVDPADRIPEIAEHNNGLVLSLDASR